MARIKTFGADDGLFAPRTDLTQEVQKQETRSIRSLHKKSLEIGTTQGRKGLKLKRINMAFSDENYLFVQKEARRQGMTMTAFVNAILDDYRIDE